MLIKKVIHIRKHKRTKRNSKRTLHYPLMFTKKVIHIRGVRLHIIDSCSRINSAKLHKL